MLEQVSIKNFTIATQVEWELQSGFHVITGETGAGKSILFDALLLCLGGRGDASLVRNGCEKAEITAHFCIQQHPAVAAFLRTHELDQDEECIITRTLTRDGRSRSYINGRASPQQLVKELGSLLTNFCAQHEHQRLLKRDDQRVFLDVFSGNSELLAEIKEQYQSWQRLTQRLHALHQQDADPARLAFLQFQLDELTELALEPGEVETLTQTHRRHANAHHLLEACQHTLALLRDQESAAVADILHQCQQRLAPFSDEPQLKNARDLIDSAEIQLTEAAHDLDNFMENIALDPAQLATLEARLNKIHDVARKHHVKTTDIDALTQKLQTDYDAIKNSEEESARLQNQIDELCKHYQKTAKKLSQARKRAAVELSEKITHLIRQLGMPHAEFFIASGPSADATPTPHGLDAIEFEIITNPGMPKQALAKVASGGELSRLCLAIQVCNASAVNTPTLLFDEVDVGIGGKTAQIVGQLLRKLGETIQIICVSHQPQVVSCAAHHFQVNKITSHDSTHTELMLLQGDARLQEVARMLGGIEITANTLAHAKEMLEGV